ncbi:MAG TPA: plastocyanin/azurin family copper-binding protein [Acidimicrobiales bacterium]|jgi:plastocyanin|nr:plastocyanin/azurin family copper-binding protein [Acidimicrobiales bacterium]
MRTSAFRARAAALALAVGVGVGSVGLSACGGGGKAQKAPEPVGAAAHIKVFQFRPERLKVKAGTVVTWINDDDITHTVTSGTREYAPGDTGQVTATHKDGQFDLPLEAAGKKSSFTFAKPGTFHYFCDRHPGMEANVEVSAP